MKEEFSLGLPEIFISFETAAVTAIARSARGAVALVLKDDTQSGDAVYRSLAEVPQSAYAAESYRMLKLAFLAGPTKVTVIRAAEDAQETFAALDTICAFLRA